MEKREPAVLQSEPQKTIVRDVCAELRQGGWEVPCANLMCEP